MANTVVGDRVGTQGRLAVGCSASVFDAARERMLLVRRVDNGRWAVPGGYMDPGESITEACTREVWEETGLQVQVLRLIGVYTTPHVLLAYADGNRWQLVVLHFEAEVIGGKLKAGAETSDVAYFSRREIAQLAMSELDRRRAIDGFAGRSGAVICDDFTLGNVRE